MRQDRVMRQEWVIDEVIDEVERVEIPLLTDMVENRWQTINREYVKAINQGLKVELLEEVTEEVIGEVIERVHIIEKI